eukprot:9501155-Heterocapsa_arctica.AAC.1
MLWRPYIRGLPFLFFARPTASSRIPTGWAAYKLYGTRLDENFKLPPRCYRSSVGISVGNGVRV